MPGGPYRRWRGSWRHCVHGSRWMASRWRTVAPSRKACAALAAQSGRWQAKAVKPQIRTLEGAVEVYTPERCYITELANTPADPAASIALARVVAGITTRW